MHRICPGHAALLHDVAATRRAEARAAAGLPPHTLMQRAGQQVARLALAIAPHARTLWVACGPGNNGGDGLEAAARLAQRGRQVIVTMTTTPERLPADAAASWARARDAGVAFHTSPPDAWDLAIDALLGIGATRAPEGLMAEWIHRLNGAAAPVLAIDLPSGLNADTGEASPVCVRARCTLTLLTVKPGLFTAQGRDTAGDVWFDPIGTPGGDPSEAVARLVEDAPLPPRPHASHKGSWGDVAVVGGAPGMRGAAALAATAALHAGAGRVYLCPLEAQGDGFDAGQPELMFRPLEALDLSRLTVVCGCGGGDAVRGALPRVCSSAQQLVLDADALNALATDPQLQAQVRARAARGRPAVLTPHPLEAARLLGQDARQVQGDRLAAAHALSRMFECVVVLKGSGTVVASPGQRSAINTSGNARLASAGTGDVLAGWIGALLAAGAPPHEAACTAVWRHGRLADLWPEGRALTAGRLARAINA